MGVAVSTIKSRILEVWGHAGFQKYFRNTSWMFFGQLIYLVVTFFIGAWIARYLGPHNYGVLNYAFAFVGLFSFITNLGIGTILSRDLVKYPEKRNELMGTSFVLQQISGLVAFSVVCISAFLLESSGLNRNLILLYATTFLWASFDSLPIYFQSIVQAKKNTVVSIIRTLTTSVLKVLFIFLGLGVIWLMGIFILDSLISTVLSIWVYKKSGNTFSTWCFDKGVAKHLLSGGAYMMLAAAASYIFTKVDQVMVKFYLDEKSVGYYAAAVRLVEIWYFIPGMICASVLPAIIHAQKNNLQQYIRRIKKLFLLLGGIACVIAVPMTLLAPYIISVLFGSEYKASTTILQIYVWSGVGLFMFWGLQQYLLTENRLKLIFFLYASLMGINIVLNMFLIPAFALTGAAWATLISYSCGIVYAVFFIRRFLKKSG